MSEHFRMCLSAVAKEQTRCIDRVLVNESRFGTNLFAFEMAYDEDMKDYDVGESHEIGAFIIHSDHMEDPGAEAALEDPMSKIFNWDHDVISFR
jgi:hypothetical protein